MFADSLLETPWANRSHRGWTTFASFAVQSLFVGALLLVPLLYTTGLPQLKLMESLVLPAPPSAMPPPPSHTTHAPVSNVAANGQIVAPPSIPDHVEQVEETTAPPPAEAPGLGAIGGTGTNWAANAVFNSIYNAAVATPLPPKPIAPPPHVSVMMEGNLIQRVQPIYPAPAKFAHVQGMVVLHATISKQGTIENLQAVSGSPMLIPAAIEAVRQWRYRPYYLNHEPIEVETQVTVNFILNRD